MQLRMVAAVSFVVAGALELLFLALSVLGTLMGGVMTVGMFAGELRGEEAMLGPLLLVFYGLWLLATLVAGPTHLACGVLLLSGREDRRLLWAGSAVSLLPMITVYCAPTATFAGVMGLVAALQKADEPSEA